VKIAVASRAVSPLHGYGGLERAVADGCAALAARGHAVTVFTATRTAAAPLAPLPFAVTEVSWDRVPVLRRGGVLDRRLQYGPFVRRLAHAIDATGDTYDVAIGHGAAAAAFVSLRKTGRVRHLLVNPHGMEEFAAPPIKRTLLRGQRALVRRAAEGADRVIATDAALVPTVTQALGVRANRIAVIPNGVNLIALDALTDSLTPPPPSASAIACTLVSVGRIEANKGLDVLATALGEIAPLLPAGWQWLHVGIGAGRESLGRAIHAAGIDAHATLCGALSDSDLHALLSRATLFVHPSRYEGSSLVTLEAMAHRLPVVATRVGGIPDKVIPGETGWLVPPNDPQALAMAIREAAIEAPRMVLQAMGAHGRTRVEAHFSLRHATDLLLALIAALDEPHTSA